MVTYKTLDEMVEFLQSTHYLHIVPQLIRDPDRSIGKKLDPFGGDFLEQIVSTNKKTKAARFRRITQSLQVAVPNLTQIEDFRDRKGTPHLKGKYAHWRSQGAWQNEDQFSDGTLRLLGLLWAALDGSGPLLLEEPELSLHPEIVRHLPGMFSRIQEKSGRQILISTHSPELLQDEGIGLNEVLLFNPGSEGTEISPATQDAEIAHLLGGGLTLGEIVLPKVRPADANQLALFGEK